VSLMTHVKQLIIHVSLRQKLTKPNKKCLQDT